MSVGNLWGRPWDADLWDFCGVIRGHRVAGAAVEPASGSVSPWWWSWFVLAWP